MLFKSQKSRPISLPNCTALAHRLVGGSVHSHPSNAHLLETCILFKSQFSKKNDQAFSKSTAINPKRPGQAREGGISPGLGDGGELGDLGGVQRRDGGSAAGLRWALRRGWRRGRRRGGGGGAKAPLGEQGVGRREARVREVHAAVRDGGGEEGSADARRKAAEHHLLWSGVAGGVGGDTAVFSCCSRCARRRIRRTPHAIWIIGFEFGRLRLRFREEEKKTLSSSAPPCFPRK